MKTNQRATILAEPAADRTRIRAILREWGYEENEIQRVLKEQYLSKEFDEMIKRSSQFRAAP